MSAYEAFLAGKSRRADVSGFEAGLIHPALFPFQAAITRWALRRGRAAIFSDTGTGKTLMELEYARQVCAHTGGNVLILAPLAVARQTVREGARFGIDARYCRGQAEVEPGITVANYEMLPHFDATAFAGVVLDEGSILKAQDGKTRTAIIETFARTPYRLTASATPAPNDFTELGNQCQFLGVLTMQEMLAMFFVHDGGSTQDWRIKGHATAAFWRWVATWAVLIKRPEDIGYPMPGYDLPPLSIEEHIVEVGGWAERQGSIFALPAATLLEQRAARRAGLGERVRAVADLVNGNDDQWLVWCGLNDEGDALERAIPGAVQVAGSDTMEHKERAALDFADGRIRVLISKCEIFGHGMNWQNCHRVAFCGIGHSFEMFYQAVRRCWRYGQASPVDVHVVAGDADRAVLENVRRKQEDADRMATEVIGHMRETMREELGGAAPTRATRAATVRHGTGWAMHLDDCVDAIKTLPEGSIHYTIFSPPFASLYTYSDSERDMGNCTTHDQFYEHFRFLVPELLRVTMPGRLLSFHCMNLPTSKARDGYIGITDFRGILIRAFIEAGWIYHSEVVIWKDPVTAMQRTKALGLLHKQIKKDAAMCRQGIPDYLVTMRKPGENPERVQHTDADMPVSLWQRYASPVWMDIRPSRTLTGLEAREEEDERHICALQLDVIERALQLWTNPGDTVLSPFAGIGSEGYTALRMRRGFIGIELKTSYWEQACANLERAILERGQATLFDLPEDAAV